MLMRGLYYEGWQLASRLQRPQDSITRMTALSASATAEGTGSNAPVATRRPNVTDADCPPRCTECAGPGWPQPALLLPGGQPEAAVDCDGALPSAEHHHRVQVQLGDLRHRLDQPPDTQDGPHQRVAVGRR